MKILHINLADQARGAALAAFRLHKAQIKAGHESRMLVGLKCKDRPEIAMLPSRVTAWQRTRFRFVNWFETATGLQYLWQPWRREYMQHPFVAGAEVIHLHNIHSGYFPISLLPALQARYPLVWTLHDLWSITGHCSYPYLHACERWKNGCGRCPALSDFPPIRIDTTALLWRIKRRLFRRTQLYLVTPSAWMADRVRQSPFFENKQIVSIAHGLDTKIFRPIPKEAARKALGLPDGERLVLFAAFDLFQERKGGRYLFQALQRLYDQGMRDLRLVTIGNDRKEVGRNFRFPVQPLGLIREEKKLAQVYSAADVYAGPSLAEAFGLVYLEAMACGTPVVAFDNSAVSEVVQHKVTGYLARTGDVDDLMHGLDWLLANAECRQAIGRQAWEAVAREFTLKRQAKRYLELYAEVIARHKASTQDKLQASRIGNAVHASVRRSVAPEEVG